MTEASAVPAGLPTGPFAQRAQFRAAVLAALAHAADVDAPQIVLVDDDFAEWPLGDRAAIESLSRWVGSRKRLVLFAHRWDHFPRLHMRFVEWRRPWAHVVQGRADAEIEAGDTPSLLLVPGHVVVRVLDRVACRGTFSAEPVDLVAAGERVDALLQRATDAFPVTTLGL
jgi:hypothetical protein